VQLQGGLKGLLRPSSGPIIHNPARVAALVAFVQRFRTLSLHSALVRVCLPDHTSRVVLAHPWEAADDVVARVAERIGLRSTEGWGLYEADSNPVVDGVNVSTNAGVTANAAVSSKKRTTVYHPLDTLADLAHRLHLRQQMHTPPPKKKLLSRLFSREEAPARQPHALLGDGGLVVDPSAQVTVCLRADADDVRYKEDSSDTAAAPRCRASTLLLARQLIDEVDAGWHSTSTDAAAVMGALATAIVHGHQPLGRLDEALHDVEAGASSNPLARRVGKDKSIKHVSVTGSEADGVVVFSEPSLAAAADHLGARSYAAVWPHALPENKPAPEPKGSSKFLSSSSSPSPASPSRTVDVPVAVLAGPSTDHALYTPPVPPALGLRISAAKFTLQIQELYQNYRSKAPLAMARAYCELVAHMETLGCRWLAATAAEHGLVWFGFNSSGCWLLNQKFMVISAYKAKCYRSCVYSNALELQVNPSNNDSDSKPGEKRAKALKTLVLKMSEQDGREACASLKAAIHTHA
jgi:hypothetical protein